jgi:hypothetical protein
MSAWRIPLDGMKSALSALMAACTGKTFMTWQPAENQTPSSSLMAAAGHTQVGNGRTASEMGYGCGI